MSGDGKVKFDPGIRDFYWDPATERLHIAGRSDDAAAYETADPGLATPGAGDWTYNPSVLQFWLDIAASAPGSRLVGIFADEGIGRKFRIYNSGTETFVLAHDDAGGAPTGQIITDGSDLDVPPGCCVTLTYDLAGGEFWRVTSVYVGASGGGTWGSITGTLADQTDLAAALADVAANLHTGTATTGNVGAGEDTLQTYSLPGGTLATNGNRIRFRACGSVASTVNAKRIRVKWGTTTIFDTGAAGIPISTAFDWSIEGQIIRKGAASQVANVAMNTANASLASYADTTLPTETLSGALSITITGEATANNDIVCESLTVDGSGAFTPASLTAPTKFNSVLVGSPNMGTTPAYRWERGPADPRYRCVFEEDFTGPNTTTSGTLGARIFTSVASGGGVAYLGMQNNHPGWWRAQTLTGNAAANAEIAITSFLVAAGNGQMFKFNTGGVQRYLWTLFNGNASTSGERVETWIGFTDTMPSAGTSTSNLYIVCVDNVNSGNWQIKATAAGVAATTVNGSISVPANSYFEIEAVFNAAGTSVEFFQNGVSIGTMSAGLPNVHLMPFVRKKKTVGTTLNRVMDWGHFRVDAELTTPIY